jgi:hypothetical protein
LQDGELIKRVQNGDESALDTIGMRRNNELRIFFYKRINLSNKC